LKGSANGLGLGEVVSKPAVWGATAGTGWRTTSVRMRIGWLDSDVGKTPEGCRRDSLKTR
jgi:hypothetical protein